MRRISRYWHDRVARGHRDLDEANPAAESRVPLEQTLEGEQAAGDPLRVVEAVDGNDQARAPRRLRNRSASASTSGAAAERVERCGVDAHGERSDADRASGEVDAPLVGLAAQHVGRRCQEVEHVRDGVEADQGRPEHALQQLAPPWQEPEDLGRGKRHVEEEADRRVGQPPPHQVRHQGQLVVVDPDQIARTVLVDDGVGEPPVDALVGLPALGLERQLIELVVEQRPQDSIGESVVVALDLGGGELDRNRPQRRQAFVQGRALVAVRRQDSPGQPIQTLRPRS